MKMFYYDSRHEEVHNEVDLGELTEDQTILINKIERFLFRSGIIDRHYKHLILAESFVKTYDEEQEPLVTFIAQNGAKPSNDD